MARTERGEPRKDRKKRSAGNPADLTACEAAAAVASGALSCEDLVGSCVERIESIDPETRAWAFLDRDLALSQAREADRLRREGRGIGPLHGVPVGIKDVIDTADMPTECGSAIFKGRQPRNDAACVAALRAAGAIILGKTVTTELASLTPGPTRNPRNPAHTPGGSSSGSAAAVAAGMVPLALGTQTAGSVIRPGSYCGVYAFKPTFGLVSRRGVLLQSHTLDTIGLYARSVGDIALLADVLGRHDPDDPVSYATSRPGIAAQASAEPPLPPLLAFVRTPAWSATSDVAREAFDELIAELGPERVHEIELPSLEAATEAQRIVQSAENAAYYGPLRARMPELISAPMTERLQAGSKVLAEDYIRAVNLRETLYASIEDALLQEGTILTPAAPGPAPRGLSSTGDPIFNGMWTYLGVPAITVPLLEVDGLPIGVQLIGPRRDDGRLLRTARWLVEHLARR